MEPKKSQFKKITSLLDFKIRKTSPFGPIASGTIKHQAVKDEEKKNNSN